MSVVLVCSVALEADPLLRRISDVQPVELPRLNAWSGRLIDVSVIVVVGGMGKTNAAHSLTLLLEHRQARGVVSFGVGGAYRRSGLMVGNVAVAAAEHYGDEGVETPSGWMSCEEIGIPLAVSDGRPLFNSFPVDSQGLSRVLAGFERERRTVACGPFVTVSACSGTAARGDEIETRHRAICESMEGAAHAHVSTLYTLPFLEMRGISNIVEDRDLTRWRLAEAAEAAADALPLLVSLWNP
jgi:futalosine hydrolase